MTDESLQGRDRTAATYLQQLQELASEISAATDAISANAMQKFCESVSRQELLCSSLASISKAVGEAMRPSGVGSAPRIDSSLDQRIRAASAELHALNLKYAALIKHSSRSIEMLSLLCKSQTGLLPSDCQPKRQTWSCEV